MSSNIVIAVGHICKKNSFLASNAPNCVNVWPVSENDLDVIVGTYYQKEFTCNLIDLTNFDKSKALEIFENYKSSLSTIIHPEEFNSLIEYNQWLLEFDKTKISIIAIVI